MKQFLCLLTLMPLCLALPAGCGSPGRKQRDTDEIDDCGTAVRNGKETDVCVEHDQEAVYTYLYRRQQAFTRTEAGSPTRTACSPSGLWASSDP